MTGEQWWESKPKANRKRWLRPRNVVLLTILAMLVWGGVFLYGVVYAEPVVSNDFRPKLIELTRARQGMPEGTENGWLILRGLVERVDDLNREFVQESGRSDTYEMLSAEVLYNPICQVQGFDRAEVVATNLKHLERLKNAGVFDELDRLCRTPFGVRISTEERFLDTMLPEVGKARALTRSNAARMFLAHSRRDDRERFEAMDQCLAMSQLELRQGTLIEYLVGVAIRALATAELRNEFIEHPPSEAECVRALGLLQKYGLGDLVAPLEGERLGDLDVIQTVFSDTGGGNGRLLLPQLNRLQSGIVTSSSGPTNTPWLEYKVCNLAGLFMPDRRQHVSKINEYFDSVVRQGGMSRRERIADSFSADVFMDQMPRSYVLLHILSPAIGKLFAAHDQSILEDVGTRLMIAVELHHARNGEYPGSLNDLVPSILPALPQDPFTDKIFGYRLLVKNEDPDGRAYLLYSYGADGIDNAGKAAKNPFDSLHSSRGRDTDFIINRPRAKPVPEVAKSTPSE